MSPNEIDRKIAVIFVADVVGYSKHMEKDENATFKAYGECETILNKLLKKYKGSIFNTAGDSVLAEFPSAVNAVECAVDFQNDLKKRNDNQKTKVKLEFRIGINMGDVVMKMETYWVMVLILLQVLKLSLNQMAYPYPKAFMI